jgi:predicted hydrocarbon binding protein
MSENEIKGVINEEVINTLVSLVESTIGLNAVKVVINNTDINKKMEGREILYQFAEAMQKTLGEKGAFASMRQVGRDLARYLMENYPREEWDEVLENALNDFGFARRIDKKKDKAYICDCVFFEILDKNNKKPISHAICWAGWGFIEGFVKEMENAKGIEWKERDYSKNMCRFDFIF